MMTGCVQVKTQKDTSGINGGVFKTIDKGATWQQKVLIPTTSGKPGNFANVNVYSMIMDPGDNNAVYFGSVGNGLLYTYDAGASWQVAKGLSGMTIRSVAIDRHAKCIIYAAVGNKVFKTTDCSRSWSQVYFDNDLQTAVNAIAIDPENSDIIYLGLSRGDLVISTDAGLSWQTIHRINKINIAKLRIDPRDGNHIYILAGEKGVYYTKDRGGSWNNLDDVLKENNLKAGVKDIIFTAEETEKIYLATAYGLLRSDDLGETWNKIELITPEKKSAINAIAVNPNNYQEIYYVTNTTFFRTSDGGENWTPIKLPTARPGWELLIDPLNPNILYMGVYAPQK